MHRHRRAAGPRRSPRRRLLGLVGGIAILLAACGTSGPTAGPSATASSAASGGLGPTATSSTAASATPAPDPATVYRTIEDQVVAIRQLTARAPVNPKIVDDAGIKKLTADSFAKDNPPTVIDANERVAKALGLLPADASLAKLYVSLLGSQVAGLYNPDDKTLYVVSRSGAIGATEKSTFSHEFTHALQDQNFDLGKLQLDQIGQGDQSFARLALVEGDATLTMGFWQIQNLSQAELGELIAGASDDESTKILLGMPPILRESLLFPYVQGMSFVQGLQARGGWQAVDDAFAKPPASTEQILHPEKYASGELPVAVTIPKDLAKRLGTGWSSASEDSFGEFQMGVWLRGNTEIGAAAANDAAAGWGGDRIALVEGPNGAWGVVLRTAWDTAADAAAFEAAATPLVAKLASPGAVLPGAGGVERWVLVGSDDATLNRIAGVLGLAG